MRRLAMCVVLAGLTFTSVAPYACGRSCPPPCSRTTRRPQTSAVAADPAARNDAASADDEDQGNEPGQKTEGGKNAAGSHRRSAAAARRRAQRLQAANKDTEEQSDLGTDAARGVVPRGARPGAPLAGGATPAGATYNDRVTKNVLLQQALAAQMARLLARRAELERWDPAAQAKFRRAFGNVEENTRQRVLKRIDALILRNRQASAALADNVNFDFYLAGKRVQLDR